MFFWLFLRQERRAREPLVDLDLFAKSVPFTKASIAFAVLFASFPLYLFVFPIVMINGLEMRAWDAGMTLGVVALATVLVAGPAGRLSDRVGAERLCMLGAAMTAPGYVDVEAAVASLPAALVTEPVAPFGMASRAAVVVAAPRVAAVDAGGNNLYNTQCIACHGPAGSGVQGLGVPLVGSEFVSTRSTDELVAFLKAGRMPGDPDNVSNRPMPGFAWVSDAELAAVADYLKEL